MAWRYTQRKTEKWKRSTQSIFRRRTRRDHGLKLTRRMDIAWLYLILMNTLGSAATLRRSKLLSRNISLTGIFQTCVGAIALTVRVTRFVLATQRWRHDNPHSIWSFWAFDLSVILDIHICHRKLVSLTNRSLCCLMFIAFTKTHRQHKSNHHDQYRPAYVIACPERKLKG